MFADRLIIEQSSRTIIESYESNEPSSETMFAMR